jgi:hypothetical protein
MPSLLGTVGVESDGIVQAGGYIHSSISYLVLSTYTSEPFL